MFQIAKSLICLLHTTNQLILCYVLKKMYHTFEGFNCDSRFSVELNGCLTKKRLKSTCTIHKLLIAPNIPINDICLTNYHLFKNTSSIRIRHATFSPSSVSSKNRPEDLRYGDLPQLSVLDAKRRGYNGQCSFIGQTNEWHTTPSIIISALDNA